MIEGIPAGIERQLPARQGQHLHLAQGQRRSAGTGRWGDRRI